MLRRAHCDAGNVANLAEAQADRQWDQQNYAFTREFYHELQAHCILGRITSVMNGETAQTGVDAFRKMWGRATAKERQALTEWIDIAKINGRMVGEMIELIGEVSIGKETGSVVNRRRELAARRSDTDPPLF